MSSLKIGLKFYQKNYGYVKNFLTKTDKRISYKNWKRRTSDDFLRKLRTTGSIELTLMINFEMCCFYVVLVLPGSVETQLRLSGKFC